MAMTNNPGVRDVLNQIVHDPRYHDVMAVPVLSLPQLMLAVISVGGFATSCWAYLIGAIPLAAAMSINLVAVYLAFTPLHDASHRAVSKDPVLNDLVGVIVGQLLLPGVNMTAFRGIHMDHHRYTGQEGRDPDTGFVHVPRWMGVSYLMFADLHWVYWFFRYGRKIWSKQVATAIYLMMVLVVVSHAAFLLSPWWKEFLLLYVIPQRLGLGVVAYTFAHIQHPEGLTWEHEPFQSTVYVRGNSPWRRLMFGQEEHTIHHLLPHVPWFKYRRVWDLANGVLRKQDIPARGWFEGPKDIRLPTAADLAPVAMRVARIRDVGEGIRSFDLEPVDKVPLADAAAGSHVVVQLSGGLARPYSVVAHDPHTNRYRIAVKREDKGRGGSRAMHALNEGDVVRVSKPRNHFVLYESAARFVLVAGGIGITPLLSMANRLQSLRKPFELHVCARDEAAVPFRDELTRSAIVDRARVHLDGPDGRSSLDLDAVLGGATPDTLLYLCGPQGFMNWLRESALARGWPEASIRIESFSAPALENIENHAFRLDLARSGRNIEVPANQTILDALLHAGVEVPYACMQGTCGTCAAHVMEGEVDHRDACLSETEKTNNDRLCLCVSRARGDRLSIDL